MKGGKKDMKSAIMAFISFLFLPAIVPLTAWCQNSNPARPGSINYVEGQAAIGSNTLSPTSIGTIELGKDQTLTTQAGKVEILLTPGVFLRVADSAACANLESSIASRIFMVFPQTTAWVGLG
jgi:hypothetical protein